MRTGDAGKAGRLRAYLSRVEALTPRELRASGALAQAGLAGRGVLVLAVLDLNDAVIGRLVASRSPWWDTRGFPWISGLEAAVPAIRAEVDRYLSRRAIPSTDALNGFDGDDPAGTSSVPTGPGTWRVLILQSFGRPIAANALHFPDTMAAIARTPARANVGLSCMDPGSRIERHRDPNRGALRVHVPIIVPGPPDASRIMVADQEMGWQEGRAVMFDLGVPHETCNESEGSRIILTLEILMPLPFPASLLNRLAQRLYRRFPSYRGLAGRAHDLATQADAVEWAA